MRAIHSLFLFSPCPRFGAELRPGAGSQTGTHRPAGQSRLRRRHGRRRCGLSSIGARRQQRWGPGSLPSAVDKATDACHEGDRAVHGTTPMTPSGDWPGNWRRGHWRKAEVSHGHRWGQSCVFPQAGGWATACYNRTARLFLGLGREEPLTGP